MLQLIQRIMRIMLLCVFWWLSNVVRQRIYSISFCVTSLAPGPLSFRQRSKPVPNSWMDHTNPLRSDIITTTKQNAPKPCRHFKGYIVFYLFFYRCVEVCPGELLVCVLPHWCAAGDSLDFDLSYVWHQQSSCSTSCQYGIHRLSCT